MPGFIQIQLNLSFDLMLLEEQMCSFDWLELEVRFPSMVVRAAVVKITERCQRTIPEIFPENNFWPEFPEIIQRTLIEISFPQELHPYPRIPRKMPDHKRKT